MGILMALMKEFWTLCQKCKNGLPISRDTVRTKALEVATSLNIPWQDFKGSKGL
jgi:hypothetical protein